MTNVASFAHCQNFSAAGLSRPLGPAMPTEIGFGLFGHRLEYANGQARKKDLPVADAFLISSNGIIRLAPADVDHTCRLDVDDIVGAPSEPHPILCKQKKGTYEQNN